MLITLKTVPGTNHYIYNNDGSFVLNEITRLEVTI